MFNTFLQSAYTIQAGKKKKLYANKIPHPFTECIFWLEMLIFCCYSVKYTGVIEFAIQKMAYDEPFFLPVVKTYTKGRIK